MPATLQFKLLGQPLILLNGELDLRVEKARALLFYLAVTRAPHSREKLSRLLWIPYSEDQWPDVPDSQKPKLEKAARDNLKTELWRLRKKTTGLESYILVGDDVVGLNRDLPLELDTEAFASCFTDPAVENLEEALKLYRGPFLHEFKVRDAPQFDQWVSGQRAWVENLLFQAYGQLARHHAGQGDYAQSLRYIEDWLTYMPDDEQVHACKLILLALMNQQRRARDYYQQISRFPNLAQEPLKALMAQIDSEILTSADLDDLLPPAPTAAAVPTPAVVIRPFQSPPRPDHLVGRIQEIDAIKQLIARDTLSLFALVGMGGIGKTTLSIRFAHELRHLFEDGVLWGDLTRSAPVDILDVWGRAYGANDIGRLPDIASRAAAFRNLMSNKRALIVIDDVKKAQQVEYLLPNNPGCVVLITTRSHYAVSQIEMMSHLTAKRFTLKGLLRQDSLSLLRIALGDARIRPETETADKLAELLGDHPLALEITAQRLKLRPDRTFHQEAQALQTAESRLRHLKIGERAIRATFDESWVLLDEWGDDSQALKQMFPQLSVFRERPFGLEAAASVTERPTDDTDELLNTFCNLSLLNREGGGRYRLHALLADYAREKLNSQQRERCLRRLAAHYRDYAARHKDAFGELDKEWSGITAGMQAAYDLKDWSLLLSYARDLEQGLYSLGRFSDARQLCRWLCRDASGHEHNNTLIELAGPRVLGDLYCRWGLYCIEQSDFEEAKVQIENGQEIFDELRDQAGLAKVKFLLGGVAREQEQLAEAELLLREAYAMYTQLNDRGAAADVLIQLCGVLVMQENLLEAKQLAERALGNFQQVGHNGGIVKALKLLARIAELNQEFDVAEQFCFDALSICERLHDNLEQSIVWYILAGIYRDQGQFEGALEAVNNNLSLAHQMGDIYRKAYAYARKASIHEAMGHFEIALKTYQQSLILLQRLGAPEYERVLAVKKSLQEKFES